MLLPFPRQLMQQIGWPPALIEYLAVIHAHLMQQDADEPSVANLLEASSAAGGGEGGEDGAALALVLSAIQAAGEQPEATVRPEPDLDAPESAVRPEPDLDTPESVVRPDRDDEPPENVVRPEPALDMPENVVRPEPDSDMPESVVRPDISDGGAAEAGADPHLIAMIDDLNRRLTDLEAGDAASWPFSV